MADDFGQEGFYNYNYDQQQQAGYDMGGNTFGQDPNFGQFDYGNQGYGDPNMYAGQGPKDQYMGSILTPDPTPQYDANATGENYEDEPPLMEELGINFDHITQKAADKDFKSLYSAAWSQKEILTKHGIIMPDSRITDVWKWSNTDKAAEHFLRTFRMSEDVPLSVNGNGNCLFNAVSKAIWGNETKATELRLRTCVEMVTNRSSYENHEIGKTLYYILPPYEEACLETARNFSYSSNWTILALASVTNREIRTLYPPVNGPQDYSYQNCNRVFCPVNKENLVTNMNFSITIMWTCTSKSVGQIWTPNHFVPVVQKTTKEETNIEDEMNDEPSDVSMDGEHDQNMYEVSESDELDDDDDKENEVPLCTLFCRKLSNRFLDFNETISLLKEKQDHVHMKSIPVGKKENMVFIIDNNRNVERKAAGLRVEYADDCGVWDASKGTSPQTKFMLQENGQYSKVVSRNGVYCKMVQRQKKAEYIPVEPQPSDADILLMCRYYTSLKNDPQYKRRVTWIPSAPEKDSINCTVAIVEYLGSFPGRAAHGNSHDINTKYIRTNPDVLKNIGDSLKTVKPMDLYTKMVVETEDENQRPRNSSQLYNKKYNDKRKERKAKGQNNAYINNIADQFQQVENMVHFHPFVQQVVQRKDKTTCVILNTERQINDLKRFCCSGNSILGIDKTYNLGEIYVTPSVFKDTTVIRRDTNDNPIHLGPVFIHGNSNADIFNIFTSHIASQFTDKELTSFTIGSDEETGITKAIARSFPTSTTLVCARHLRGNVQRHLVTRW